MHAQKHPHDAIERSAVAFVSIGGKSHSEKIMSLVSKFKDNLFNSRSIDLLAEWINELDYADIKIIKIFDEMTLTAPKIIPENRINPLKKLLVSVTFDVIHYPFEEIKKSWEEFGRLFTKLIYKIKEYYIENNPSALNVFLMDYREIIKIIFEKSVNNFLFKKENKREEFIKNANIVLEVFKSYLDNDCFIEDRIQTKKVKGRPRISPPLKCNT